MRMLPAAPLLFVVLATCALPACGQPAKDTSKEKRLLSVGDPAPAWKVDLWLNGGAVAAPAKNKVYVLEFWATWCGPCIAAMPHLAALQADHKADGLVVIGMTNRDDNGNDKASVTKFVAERGPKLGYVFGYSDTPDTYAAYMDAAGQDGIPCSFVIDRDGKIAYIGHPMMLDDVLPKVLAGKWNGKADAKAVYDMNVDLDRLLYKGDNPPEKRLDELAAFAKTHPEKAGQPVVQAEKLRLLLRAKRPDDAKGVGEALVAASEKKERSSPADAVMMFASKDLNPDKKHLDVAVKAADLVVKYADDYRPLLGATEVYAAAGQKDKATAAGKKAVDAAPTPKAKENVGKQVDKILAGK